MHNNHLGTIFWCMIHVTFLWLLLCSFVSCGKIDVNTRPVRVDHNITIDVEAFKELCQYSESPETCIDDLITKYGGSND